MVPTTRSQNPSEALKHIRTQVLQEGAEKGRLLSAFQALGLENTVDFMILGEEDFGSAVFEWDTNKEARLTILEIRRLAKLQEWYQGQPERTTATWFTLDADGFQTYLISGTIATRTTTSSGNAPTASTDNMKITSSGKYSAADEFIKGVKRDPTHYKDFTDDRKWVTWHRHFTALAATHNLDSILDANYKPTKPDEVELFKVQQVFAYSIFDRCLKTAKSLTFVRRYEVTKDAQALYTDLLAAYQTGVIAENRERHARTAIQNHRLDDSWSRPLESFFTSFEHKLLDLEEIQGKPIEEVDKRKYLQDAISGHDQLYQAVTMSRVTQEAMGKDSSSISYDMYYSIIKSHAMMIDEKTKAQHRGRRVNNNANQNNTRQKKKDKDTKGQST